MPGRVGQGALSERCPRSLTDITAMGQQLCLIWAPPSLICAVRCTLPLGGQKQKGKGRWVKQKQLYTCNDFCVLIDCPNLTPAPQTSVSCQGSRPRKRTPSATGTSVGTRVSVSPAAPIRSPLSPQVHLPSYSAHPLTKFASVSEKACVP